MSFPVEPSTSSKGVSLISLKRIKQVGSVLKSMNTDLSLIVRSVKLRKKLVVTRDHIIHSSKMIVFFCAVNRCPHIQGSCSLICSFPIFMYVCVQITHGNSCIKPHKLNGRKGILLIVNMDIYRCRLSPLSRQKIASIIEKINNTSQGINSTIMG